MRKALVAALLVLMPAAASAQIVQRGTASVPPIPCARGMFYVNTNSNVVWACVSPDTWATTVLDATKFGSAIGAQVLLPDGTAAAPAMAFTSAPTTGFAKGGSSSIRWYSSGTLAGQLSSNICLGGALDGCIAWDAANTLAMRNGGTAGAAVPQTFNNYKFCDGASCVTGYERATQYWNGDVYTIKTEAAGTGSNRNISITPAAGVLWVSGATLPATGDAYALGSSTNLWKIAYLSQSIQGSKSKALVDAAAAVTFTNVAVGDGGYAGGEIIWDAVSTDTTDYRSLVGRTRFAAVQKGATVTCAVAQIGTDLQVSSNASALACTISCAGATDSVDLKTTCTDNTAGTQTMSFNYRLDMPIIHTITPQ